MPGNYLLDLLSDVLCGHLILLLIKRDELLVRQFTDLVLAKIFDHGVENLIYRGIGPTDFLHGVNYHIFEIVIFEVIRGLLGVDEAISSFHSLEILTQRLANLGGKSFREYDALGNLDVVENILLGAGLVG